jgi:hypothetical protein
MRALHAERSLARLSLGRCLRAVVLGLPLAVALTAPAQATSVRHDPHDPAGSLFPSDRHTVRDGSQRTFRRVQLPRPDCAVRPSDCADIDVINTLDGFSTQPRITVPFTGPIDVASVNSDTVFLLNLGDTFTLQGFGRRVGINQVVWDPATNTLVLQPDELLQEHSRHLLVVTDGVRDAAGRRLRPSRAFDAALAGPAGRDTGEYHRDLRDAARLHRGGHRVVAASLFTTQSSTVELRKIRQQLQQAQPAPADFMIGRGTAGPVRALFATAGLNAIRFRRQVGTGPDFAEAALPLPALNLVPGAVAAIAYGRYRSPDYQTADKFFPPTSTLAGEPQPQGSRDLVFQLFLPAGPRPAAGWPVVLFGHGFGDSMFGAPWTVASVMAAHGLATLSIHVVGHGGGAQGQLLVLPAAGEPVQVDAGGRGFDQDGNGRIDSTEGVNAAAPRIIIGSRDGLRQTVVDLLQLVRQVQAGLDVDGDGRADLDAQRLYYAGQSFGGIYGTMLLAVEPALRAGVPNVPGGSITEIARLGAFRPLSGQTLAARTPSLINVADPSGIAFNENLPLRDQPPVVNDVAGAMAIAQFLDRTQWVQQPGNPVSYAALIRRDPPPGQHARPVLVQLARGDVTVPNPTTTAILRAGALADRAVYFRNDLAVAANPAVPRNPHTFLTNIGNPAVAPFAVAAQTQMARFFASDGATVTDPDGDGPLFEVPIVPPLPEGLNFLN